ncbi:MAG: UDP-glucose 4-epimerase [Parcubacteria group bacterium Gr01-1014_18]|nr:MAG: UDP-glucose 4-epimerase [Parcubacteria group bacterium Greene0416_36]TSC81298.1 MAG: UDP-glucose 4-epimerase [Parcubacteria group bacterium Gr01-1014_18]TSC99320.1 MAG: UDP-glucose 4-epimerase [Parcubacteria group bacterium Greene1014_20]TSD06843.1 MAG: UDP-glucose 4-epimerase [Parcubacteria group bacterium Greene0714_2]
MGKSILVTGGAGFIGSHLVDALVLAGHVVVVVDDLSVGKKMFLNKGARFSKKDIRSESMDALFKKYQFDWVFHLAAHKSIRHSLEHPSYDADINIMGSLNIIELAVKYGVERLIFPSSAAVYGNCPTIPSHENINVYPISPYGISKYSIELYLNFLREHRGLCSAALRFSSVYGPRQDTSGDAGVIAVFVHKVIKGETPTVFGDGTQSRDFVFVGDIVRAAILAAESSYCGVVNVGTNHEISLNMLLDSMRRASGKNFKVEYADWVPGEIRRSLLDNSLAQRVLGWAPEVSLDEGLRRTFEYFRAK